MRCCLQAVGLLFLLLVVYVAHVKRQGRAQEPGVEALGVESLRLKSAWVPRASFSIFLSHHKEDAGSDARYLRDLLQVRRTKTAPRALLHEPSARTCSAPRTPPHPAPSIPRPAPHA